MAALPRRDHIPVAADRFAWTPHTDRVRYSDMSFWEYANPRRFMAFSDRLLPPLTIVTALLLGGGLFWGFFVVPDDYKQGSTVRIIFLHVPAALMAINAWLMMLVASLIWLVRRHHVSALAARAAAPVGMVFTLMALFTGAVWGQPMWGTWWVWDPRLTSFLILFLFYLGYMALWSSVENADVAADLTSVLCIVGSIFALLSRYAVNFWNQGLHQGASMSVRMEGNVHDVYFYPLMACMLAFVLLFVVLVLVRTRTEIRARRVAALIARERLA